MKTLQRRLIDTGDGNGEIERSPIDQYGRGYRYNRGGNSYNGNYHW